MIWVQVTLSGSLLVRLEPVYDLGTSYSQWVFTSETRASLHDLGTSYSQWVFTSEARASLRFGYKLLSVGLY